jgi:hypothetical protein
VVQLVIPSLSLLPVSWSKSEMTGLYGAVRSMTSTSGAEAALTLPT